MGRTSRRVWTASSQNRSPVLNPRGRQLPPRLHQLQYRWLGYIFTNFFISVHWGLSNSVQLFLQTTGRASPLERDSQSPLPPSVAEAKNRSIILKQEDFVKKKEEPAKKKEEEIVKKEKMEKTSSRSGLSCLRPNTLDEDTEAFTRCRIFLSFNRFVLADKNGCKTRHFLIWQTSPGVLREERLHSVLEEGV